ncbi:ABC transporter permease [Stutzerimonas kunmingensis]|uniref:ABC transporter permease n=1 Tax=Stutzerimonas kunmingensis TaxID=1211807 RepID=UPI003119244C
MDMIASWIGNIPDFAVPFALAALGLIVIERSGVLALGAEGLMLVGALAGIGASLMTGGATVWALILAMCAAGVVSLLFALMVLVMRINQVIAGLALVFFCQGLTGLLGTLLDWTNKPVAGLHAVSLWPFSELPVVGKLFVQNPLVFVTPLIFVVVVLVLNRSVLGLRLRAVGENPQAADAAGIPVLGYRCAAIVAGSMLIGLAGAYISVLSTKMWIADMVGGRGWITVALVIFARWQPLNCLWAALLFGASGAVGPALQAVGISSGYYLFAAMPYALTLLVMYLSCRPNQTLSGAPGELSLNR